MGGRRERIGIDAARRIALAAQGFAEPRPAGPVTARHVRRVLDRIALLQIDSVNVLVRSHYLPLFSRLGPYPHALLEQLAYARKRELFEYWAHEASLLPLAIQPLLRWRMEDARTGIGLYKDLTAFARERGDYLDRVRAEIGDRGALGASELTEAGPSRGAWWGWSDGKIALEYLFWAGEVTTATRRNFERVYDLPERVLPDAVLASPAPARDEAQRALLRLSLQAHGIASERCLRDYFRLGIDDGRARLAELVEAGEALPVEIRGLERPYYLDPSAKHPRRIEACALLSPFDSLVFERDRTQTLFGFRYRLELYTPAEKRQYGYYVLPFLLGDRIAARVDLKSDRATSRLLVHAAYGEPGEDTRAVVSALAAELLLMAQWLGLERVAVGERGDLAGALGRSVA